MDLKARIAAFESGTPLLPPESPTSPPRPLPSSLEEITRTSIEAARRRAGSSASASSSNGGSAGWGEAPVGLGLGHIKPSAARRIPSSGSSVGGRAPPPPPPPQVTLNGGREGDIPLTRTSPKVPSSSIISLYPSSPSSPIQPRTTSSSHAPSIRPIEPSRSPSPSNSFTTTSSSNGRPAFTSSNSTSSVPLNDFSARLRPSALRSSSSSSTTSLPNFNSPASSSSTPSSNPSLLRKPPPPPAAPQNLGLPMPKSPPPPSPTTPKPHRSQSARGPVLSLQTATPEGSPDPNSDMITFSPINHPSRAGSRGSGAAGSSPIRRSTIPLSSPSSSTPSTRALPPPLPSRPIQPNALNPSPSKHRPTLSTSSFQSVELEGSENEKEDDSSSLITPIAPRGPSFSSPISTPNLSRTSSTSSMKPPPLPQRKPSVPPANTNEQPSSPITYAPRVRRVPPPPPSSNQPTQPPLILSARPTPQNTSSSSRGPPTLPPKPSNLLSSSPAAQPTQASLARYNSLFTKLVALRRVAAMQALMSAPSSARASTESKPGWKRASFVAASEGGEEEKKGSGGAGGEERLEGKVVKLVWERSKLSDVVLKGVWDRVEKPRGTGSLDREAFVKGMGEIDEELRRARVRSRGGGVGSGRTGGGGRR